MNFSILRTAAAIATTVLLTACGAGTQEIHATQTASISASGASLAQEAAVPSTGAPVAPVVSANMPAPDCAAEGCGSLRIIDGNAEAFRIDAQRRDALQASLPQA
ncbi:hypothetical protein [Massilia sp. ST3]|uniref:hypothetical protein n=1 Tax=Massilia sp. ST3 TaxID=2824903 RepID=UPI001B8234E4|nr:hypothetical protein [Massilia sp. ST3]MBQ5950306.1 hypothetical protein [Massilia sp. ST3]